MTLRRCPVCLDAHSTTAKIVRSGFINRVECPVCGEYDIDQEIWDDFLDPQIGVGSKLTPFERSKLAHRIRTATPAAPSSVPRLTEEMIDRFIQDGCPGPSPGEQAVNAIRYIGDYVGRTGDRLKQLPVEFFTEIGAPNPDFAGELTIELKTRGLVDGREYDVMGAPLNLEDVNLTLDGWARYEDERKGKFSGNYGFIAMKFNDPILDPFVREVVKPSVKANLNFDLVDMNDVARAGIIDNIMRAQIRDAAFVIVDLTHDNSGAYWEAGYAEGLGKPVIYICERAKFEDKKTHFDTNHCTTVIWSKDDTGEFAKQLIATLRRSLNIF